MRLWPWGGDKEETDDVERYDEDLIEDEEPGDEGGEEQPEDPLAELDEGTRAAAEAYALRQVEQERARWDQGRRTAAENSGFHFDSDGRVVIVDPAKASRWLGSQEQPAPRQPPPAEVPVELGPPPDRLDDPDGYIDWLEKKQDQRFAALQAQLEQTNASVRQAQVQGIAMQRVTQAVTAHLPQLGDVTAHPDFEDAFRGAMATATPEQWSDPRVLAATAANVAIYLDPSKMPKPSPRDRGQDGRFQAAERAETSRLGLSQIAPSRSGGTQPQGRGPSEVDRELARMAGMSAEEWMAAADPFGNALRAQREKQAKARR